MKVYIYQIWFPTTNKSYIGQTDNLKRRVCVHLITDSLVGRALRKYDDWRIFVLHTTKTRDEANRIEIEEIRNFNSIRPNGYNITRGGAGGGHCTPHSEEAIEKMRQSKLGKNNPMYGKHLTKETRAKISANSKGMKGKYHSEETKKKMSIAQKGKKRKPFTEEHKAKLSASHKGKKHTEETKAKMSIAHKGIKRGHYKKRHY